MSLAYHWTPLQIADMTLEQIWIYRSQAADAGESVSLSSDHARTYRKSQRAARAAWIESVLQELKHGIQTR